MFLIIGLGNPGAEYVNTRHNAGFELLDLIADEFNIEINKSKFKSMVGEGFINNKKVILIKPMTYMNLSGEALIEALNFYKVNLEEFIVCYDDVTLEPGAIRLRKKGSSGGHNGIKNIISLLGSDEFNRVKIGVGAPKGNLVKHVLGKIPKEVENDYVDGLLLGKEAIKEYIHNGMEASMNKFNSSKKELKNKKDKKGEIEEDKDKEIN